MTDKYACIMIDKDGLIKSQNEVAYEYFESRIGDKIYSYVVNPDEVHKWLENFLLSDEKEDVQIIKYIRFDKTKRVAYVKFQKNESSNEQVAVEFTDVEDLITRVEQLTSQKKMGDSLLDMLGEIMFIYDNKTSVIQLFMLKNQHRIILYECKLSQWQNEMLEDTIADGYDDIFADFCQHIRDGVDDETEVVLNHFFDNADSRIYSCKVKQFVQNRTQRMMLGVIRERKDFHTHSTTLIDYSKDPNMNILTQKAITEYAKRAISTSFGRRIYLVLLDMDDFQNVNNTLGHLFGDEVLSTAAKIVQDAVREVGMVGRVGGDEMLIVLESGTELTELRNTLRTIRTNIEWAFRDICTDIRVTCTMGAACYPNEGTTFEEVFQTADRMLYRGKEKGKNRYIIYRPEIHGNQGSEVLNGIDFSDVESLKKNKVEVMHKVLSDFLIAQTMPNDTLLRLIGLSFELDTIILVYEHGSVAARWIPDEISNLINEIKPGVISIPFLQTFEKMRYRVVNKMEEIADFPDIREAFERKGLKQMIVYRFGEEMVCPSYAVFCKSSDEIPWSDYDILSLTLVAQTLGLTVENR